MSEIVYISEHYDPLVGGSVTYVKKICEYIAVNENRVTLIVPDLLNESNSQQCTEVYINDNLRIVKLHTIRVFSFDILHRQDRYKFISAVNEFLKRHLEKTSVSVVHVLYGMYLLNGLNIKLLKEYGVRTFVTVHNVPPAETGVSWPRDYWWHRLKDYCRKVLIKKINEKRINNQAFDEYIVPSSFVKKSLSKYISENIIQVIGHGHKEDLNVLINNSANYDEPINILTVGGIVPHKNQLAITDIAVQLLKNGHKFIWKIVGPIRNGRYYHALLNKIHVNGLTDHVLILTKVSDSELEDLYTDCKIYVQLSKEEGFCFTVLDAALRNKYILATPVGAIREIVSLANGELIDLSIKGIVNALSEVINTGVYIKTSDRSMFVKNKFNWSAVANTLLYRYGINKS